MLYHYIFTQQHKENLKILFANHVDVFSSEWPKSSFEHVTESVLTEKRPDFIETFVHELMPEKQVELLQKLTTVFPAIHSAANEFLSQEQHSLSGFEQVHRRFAIPHDNGAHMKFSLKNFIDFIHYFVDLCVGRKNHLLV